MVLRRLNLGRKGFVMFILVLPMWMNFILRILAWQLILSSNGILNFILQRMGLSSLPIANTGIALMIGVVYDYLPYMILPIFNAISEIDEDVIEAARDLGANGFIIFRKIIFPLSIPGLLSGIVMVFVPSMTSFVTSDILGGGKLQLIGNVIEQEFTKSMDWYTGSGLSVSLMIFVLISMAFTTRHSADGKESAVW
jgi:spermidine/putrescine transport system permease protein